MIAVGDTGVGVKEAERGLTVHVELPSPADDAR
jgi:hypothetical protein